MRVLFLTQVLPFPLDAGPKVRAYYVLRHLLEGGHHVTLASFTRADDLSEATTHLRDLGTTVHTVPMRRSRLADAAHWLTSLPTGTPFLVARDRSRAMRRLLDRLVTNGTFDAIHADQLWTLPYGIRARRRARGTPLLVADRHNAVQRIPLLLAGGEASPLRRAALRLEARKLRGYEPAVATEVDRTVWVSEQDRRTVEGPRPFPTSRVIPICVDPGEWKPVPGARLRRRVTFLGGLHWPPNAAGVEWFLDAVWPRIRAASTDATLTVLGRAPASVVARLRRLQGGADVEITGRVLDPTPYLRDTAAFVVPLHAGGGMRVKILDAWSRGLPVVSTRLGCEGIDGTHERELLVADDDGDFAAAVTRLLRDPELQDRLGRQARSRVETTYDWRRRYRDWDDVYPRGAPAPEPVDDQEPRAAGARR